MGTSLGKSQIYSPIIATGIGSHIEIEEPALQKWPTDINVETVASDQPAQPYDLEYNIFWKDRFNDPEPQNKPSAPPFKTKTMKAVTQLIDREQSQYVELHHQTAVKEQLSQQIPRGQPIREPFLQVSSMRSSQNKKTPEQIQIYGNLDRQQQPLVTRMKSQESPKKRNQMGREESYSLSAKRSAKQGSKRCYLPRKQGLNGLKLQMSPSKGILKPTRQPSSPLDISLDSNSSISSQKKVSFQHLSYKQVTPKKSKFIPSLKL